MKEIKNENYTTIQGWMINELELKDKELMCYAVIYGFTQNISTQKFTGSRAYLAEWCGCDVKTIQRVLNRLVEKELVIKNEVYINNIKCCEYISNDLGRVKMSLVGSKCPGGRVKMTHNSTSYNTNISIYSDCEPNSRVEEDDKNLENLRDSRV